VGNKRPTSLRLYDDDKRLLEDTCNASTQKAVDRLIKLIKRYPKHINVLLTRLKNEEKNEESLQDYRGNGTYKPKA